MPANGFQNMTLIAEGFKAPVAGMGKTLRSASTGSGGEFAALLASFGTTSDIGMQVQTEGRGFSGLGREFAGVLHSLSASVEKTSEAGKQNLMTLMGLDGTPGQKTQTVMSALTLALSGETGGKTQDLFVDSKGLDALADLLGAAGFDTEKIAAFIKDKKEGMADGSSMSTPLSSLLTSLGQFMKENDPGETWDISALPHIQTALEGFGIPREDAERIADSISENREGVDVDRLIAALIPYAGASVQSTAVQGNKESVLPVALFSGMGFNSNLAPSETTSASVAMTGPEEVLGQAVRGEVTLDQFLSKLESLTGNSGTAHAQRTLAENFAGVFASSIQAHKQTTAKEGAQAWTSLDITGPGSGANALRFDTKKPLDAMFTENGNGPFKGNLKSAGDENTWSSAHGTETGKKQPGFDGVLKNVSSDESAHTTSSSELESSATLVKAAAKGKNSLAHDSGEQGNHAVKSLAGTGFYGKTAETAQAGISEKTLPAYVTDQVARQISKAVRNGDSEIRFHIKPPDMGRVELSIATTASGLKISILTEHSATRDLLMNQTTDLRTILADQGIRVEKMDVGLSGDFGQNMAQARHDSDQSGKGRKQKDKPLFTLDPVAEKTRGDTGVTRIGAAGYTRGKLDLVA